MSPIRMTLGRPAVTGPALLLAAALAACAPQPRTGSVTTVPLAGAPSQGSVLGRPGGAD